MQTSVTEPPLGEVIILGIVLAIMYFIIFYGMYRDMKVKKDRDYQKQILEKQKYEQKKGEMND